METTSGRSEQRRQPSGGGRSGPAWLATPLFVVLLAAACGSASVPSSAPSTPEPARRATAHSGGLSITLTVTPARAGERAVDVTAEAQESQAPGSLTYQVSYGDGAQAQNAAPLLCQAGPSGPARATWRLSHRYAHSGTYRVSLTVHAACTPDAAQSAVSISVG